LKLPPRHGPGVEGVENPDDRKREPNVSAVAEGAEEGESGGGGSICCTTRAMIRSPLCDKVRAGIDTVSRKEIVNGFSTTIKSRRMSRTMTSTSTSDVASGVASKRGMVVFETVPTVGD
jgi:hypothetical protein